MVIAMALWTQNINYNSTGDWAIQMQLCVTQAGTLANKDRCKSGPQSLGNQSK